MATTYTFEQLKEDVRKEAEALRVHATDEERGRLQLRLIHADSSRQCIYGLMTGHCFNKRAAELIKLCAINCFGPGAIARAEVGGFEAIEASYAGSLSEDFVNERTQRMSAAKFSAIEVYIALPEANKESLISYLRGETETLEL